MISMKKTYQKPEITDIQADISAQILESSYIPIGGTGGFDSRETIDWVDEMDIFKL